MAFLDYLNVDYSPSQKRAFIDERSFSADSSPCGSGSCSRRGSIADDLSAPEVGLAHSPSAGTLLFRPTRRRCFIDPDFLNDTLHNLIVSDYGESVWETVKTQAHARISGSFAERIGCNDRMTSHTVHTAADVLGLKPSALWKMLAATFFSFCEQNSYDQVLNSHTRNLRDILESLDALHDHLSSIYPSMRCPSFRCWETCDTGTVVQFHSERRGLEDLVEGLLRVLAEDERVEAMHHSGEHAQFLLTPRQVNGIDDNDEDDCILNDEPKISPATFCRCFPFHIMFTRSLHVSQTGDGITTIVPELEQPLIKMPHLFRIVRPNVSFEFNDITAHQDAVFVLKLRDDRLQACCPQTSHKASCRMRRSVPSLQEDSGWLQRRRMPLKGQMIYVEETDKILFVCSPHVDTISELSERGLYLSDLPLHDSRRDLLLLSEQLSAEYDLTKNLQEATETCQRTNEALEEEKELADKLLYSILPEPVADQLRLGQPVPAVKYHSASILFSGVCDFNVICASSSPIVVVQLLNELFQQFDALAGRRIYDVYKVETAGDKYMLASGLPKKSACHARNTALAALDLMDIARSLTIDGLDNVQIRMGIHSGEVVCGVVGQSLPHYAVFGNTVCIASRMESLSLPDHINVSQATYDLLVADGRISEAPYTLQERGSIQAKGVKGPVNCYSLLRNTSVRRRSRIQNWMESGALNLSLANDYSPSMSPKDSSDVSPQPDVAPSVPIILTDELGNETKELLV